MAQDIQKLFNETLPELLKNHPDKVKEADATFQVNITGAGGGSWFIDATATTGPKVEQGVKAAKCTASCSVEDFNALLDKPAVGMMLFASGRLKVSGDVMLAMKLAKLFT